jgi:NADH-quinone oxidoreductase subunit E
VNQLLSKYPKEIERIKAKYPPDQQRSALMPLLFLAQREEGYISLQSLVDIGEITGVTTTEVATLTGFYSLFHQDPAGKYRIQICNDIACAMRGADTFLQQVCDYLGIKPGETTVDGLFTVEGVMCLASCHNAPMFQVQGDGVIRYHDHQTLETAIAFIEEVRKNQTREDA